MRCLNPNMMIEAATTSHRDFIARVEGVSGVATKAAFDSEVPVADGLARVEDLSEFDGAAQHAQEVDGIRPTLSGE